MRYVICLGSNENREVNMALAHRKLTSLFPDIVWGTLEETPPIGWTHAHCFLNQVAKFTSLSSEQKVREQLKAIEKMAGRTDADKLQQIVRLDIDLLAAGRMVFKPQDMQRDYIIRGLKELEAVD